jgi:hypothetical protein
MIMKRFIHIVLTPVLISLAAWVKEKTHKIICHQLLK